jgi:hypothetical protein
MFTSPTLTGTPLSTTAVAGTNNTQIATTAFVTAAVSSEDTLAEMNDTTISAPADSHFLVHTGSAWVNETGATARTSLGVDAAGTVNYTHPSHPGDDIDVDTTALIDAEVVSDIDINVTTDALGHVTDANGTVSTRTLTLANLGYTGSATANNYSHPNSDGDLHVPATSTTNNGKLLTAGSTAGAISWQDAPVSLPSQSGNSGKHLTTNGSAASWDDEITLSNWKITETGGVLYFSTGGVNKMKLDTSGNLTVVGDVISNGTV